MHSTIVKLMSPVNGWMAICGDQSRFQGIAESKC
jgi:hypothetical protein